MVATWGIESFGVCFDSNNKDLLNKDNITPRNTKGGGALKVFADVEMLRNGKEFFGLFDSNLVRMVHRLRFPHLNRSHALATDTYPTGDYQRYTNENMFNIHWTD